MAHQTKRAALLSALEAFIERFNAPETVLRARILALRVEYGAPEELCSLLQLDGIGIKQATQLHAQGVRSPFDLTPATLARLVSGTRIARSIDGLPKIAIDMQLPDSVPFRESAMCYATISNAQGGARLTVTVFANGLKMFRDQFLSCERLRQIHSNRGIWVGKRASLLSSKS